MNRVSFIDLVPSLKHLALTHTFTHETKCLSLPLQLCLQRYLGRGGWQIIARNSRYFSQPSQLTLSICSQQPIALHQPKHNQAHDGGRNFRPVNCHTVVSCSCSRAVLFRLLCSHDQYPGGIGQQRQQRQRRMRPPFRVLAVPAEQEPGQHKGRYPADKQR